MTSETRSSIMDAAVTWHVRLRDGDAETWEAFAEWLAQDPEHAAAYDEVEALDEDIGPFLPASEPPSIRLPEPPRSRRGWRWAAAGGGMLAACVAGLLLVQPQSANQRRQIATSPGEQKVVRLASGSSVILNGSTRLVLDDPEGRSVELVQGQALFSVSHDEDHPFTVVVGDARVVDVGTVFDVSTEAETLRVAVSEGSVLYCAGRHRRQIGRGQLMSVSSGGTVRLERVGEDAVGAWRERRLVYSGTSLSQVAADVGRTLGIAITADRAIAGRPFTGTLVLPKDLTAARARLQVALNVTIDVEDGAWSMKPASEVR